MREVQTIQLGDFTYTASQLPATRALKLFHKLAAAASPAIGKLASAVAEGGGKLDAMDVSALGPALEAVFDKLSAEQFLEVTKELMQSCVVTGEGVESPDLSKREVFDAHFTGRLADVFKVLKFALAVNYGDFLAELIAFAVKSKPKATAAASLSLPS